MELWMELQWQLRWQLRPPSGTEPKQPNPSRIQAQPVQKPAPEKLPNVAFWRPQERKDVKKGQRQCLTSPDRQLRKHEKTMQKPCSGWICGWSCNGSFGGRNSQTPAGFKPNLSKNQPPKKCLTSPSDAHKKDEERPTPMPDIARQAASKAWKNHAKTTPWPFSLQNRRAWAPVLGWPKVKPDQILRPYNALQNWNLRKTWECIFLWLFLF